MIPDDFGLFWKLEVEQVGKRRAEIWTYTSGKLWLKMRRMNVISPVLHIFVSSLRLKHRMRFATKILNSVFRIEILPKDVLFKVKP